MEPRHSVWVMFTPSIHFIFSFLHLIWIKEKDSYLSEILKNKRPFDCFNDIQIRMKFSFSCVHSYQMQNYRYLDSVHNLLFSSLFTCRCETHISRKVPKTKDFYEFTRCRQHTVSTWTVCPNWSTGLTLFNSYPPSHKIRRSLASVAESQLT